MINKEIKNDLDTPNPFAKRLHRPESEKEAESVSDGKAKKKKKKNVSLFNVL